MPKRATLLVAVCLIVLIPALAQTAPPSLPALRQSFLSPPDDARIMMRWWWFGPAVTPTELEREMRKMKEGGIGGFEIQSVYPLELDDAGKSFRNLPYLSGEFLDNVRFANRKGKELGLRVDVTLGSGWPFGGPHIPADQASARLRLVTTAIPAEADSVALPNLAHGEHLISVFLAAGSPRQFDAAGATPVPVPVGDPLRLQLPADPTRPRVALFFIAGRTGQMVKRAAVGAEGLVLDHLDRAAVENHLRSVGEPLLSAFGDNPPYAIFSDSLEAFEADWTGDLPQEFRARRGYDLLPRLPLLFAGAGDEAANLRHDWGQTLTELVNERYLKTINAWAARHHTRFRSQTYGTPAVMLSSNNLVDLPEGEGCQWRTFSTMRWASSANHLYGRPVTSSETWTWLHSPSFRATPLDLKAEADVAFLQGINQLVGHGWPYSPPEVGEPGWALYASGAFSEHNPWWPVMPELARYLQRMSFLLRQGEPANDVALFLPTDDAWAGFAPGKVSVTEWMKEHLAPALTEQILDAGFAFDYIDAATIEAQGIHHPVLVLPRVDRIPVSVYRKIEEYAKAGGKVIAIGSTPAHAPGLLEFAQASPQVQEISNRLFGIASAPGRLAPTEKELGAMLQTAYPPDLRLDTSAPELGFVHRRLSNADIYFLANTGNRPIHTAAAFRGSRTHAEWWDPMTGTTALAPAAKIELALAPYESRVLILHSEKASLTPQHAKNGRVGDPASPVVPPQPAKAARGTASGPAVEGKTLIDLSRDWKVSFTGIGHSTLLPTLQSWTESAATRFYSGEAVYEKDFELPANLARGGKLFLDFGDGTPVEKQQNANKPGMRAWLESPVREAAVVVVNGKPAGTVWHPPYRLDIGSLLHPGNNHLEIRVYNLAINTLAGRTLPDFRLLNSRYGQRFQPQDMENLQPLPSGILATVQLRRDD